MITVEVLSQFGRARHLRVRIERIEFETPNIILSSGPPPSLDDFGFPTPVSEGSEINFPIVDYIPYGSWAKEEGGVAIINDAVPGEMKEYDIVFVPFASNVLRSPRATISFISSLRRKMREDAILYLHGEISPSQIPILAYLGVDLFDSFFLAKRGRVKEESELRRICERVRKWIDEKSLRRRLEVSCRKSQRSASLLKLSERELFQYLEMGYPVNKKGRELMTVFEEAIERPDVKRYCQRILTRYTPPDSRKILLILPCSARKPYSFSRTHRIISREIGGIKGIELVQEVIATSPLGAVPRELEEVYPVKNYDVPVTGHWSQEEIELSVRMIEAILRKGKYERVIGYFPEDYYFLESIQGMEIIKGEFLSKDSLRRLKEEIKEEIRGREIPKVIKAEIASSILSYQFGEGAEIPEGSEVRGRDFRHYRIFLRGKQLAAYDRNRGYFSLTLEGAKEVLRGGYWAEIDDFSPKGIIFCAGILDADPKIREGDEVAVYHEEELRAVGISFLPGKTLRECKRGKGIKVRHHVREEAFRA